MSVKIGTRRFLALACFVLAAAAPGVVRAQTTDVRTLERNADGLVLEFTASWPRALQAALDSARADRLTGPALAAASGGLLETSETVTLPGLSLPRARLLASDYDEVDLALGPDAVAAALDAPLVEATGLGVTRGEAAATVAVRLVVYDAARGLLRRYRRLVVAVDYAAPEAAGKSGRAAFSASPSDNPHLAVERSVLTDGTVYKIPITEEGIYRIDRAFLEDLGANPDAVEPNNVKLYHNGGAPLPALAGADRPADLVENPVFVQGGGDGRFDAADALYFYAAAPRGWRWNDAQQTWTHYVNPFSNENYVFLKLDGAAGARVGAEAFPNLSGAEVYQQVTGRHAAEYDEYMWSKVDGSGLTWVSRTVRAGGSRPLLENVALPGLVAGPVDYRVRVAIRTTLSLAAVTFRSGSAALQEVLAPGTVGTSAESPTARATERSFSQANPGGAALSLSMRLGEEPSSAEAAIDWLRVFYPQALQAEGGYLRFATPGGASGPMEFVLTGFASEPQVWDVTEPGAVKRLGVSQGGGGYRVQLTVADAAEPRELVAFTTGGAAVRAPEGGTRVAAQNLHGEALSPDFVIVAPEAFLESTEELAEMRRADGLRVLVTRIDQIYNEFSGGLVDMRAVRDYLKFFYDRALAAGTEPLRYALLFGDGHNNFRLLGDASERPELENWIPPYETDESFSPEASYTSDDYFGLLDDHEGVWVYTSNGSPGPVIERVDLGVGRFTVQSAEEARVVLDKIKHYESPATYGPWRSRYTFLADDGPTGLSGQQDDLDLHLQNADVVAEAARQEFPELNVKKIYATSYSREFRNGYKVPGARQAALAAIRNGTLLFNYSGHGGPDGLAQEEIFTREDAEALENYDELVVFVTATCEFGWWDADRRQSGAEALLLNPRGGAIALMTTVRLVYTWSDTTILNVGLNLRLNREMFKPGEDGRPRRMGDVLRITKNTRVGLEGNNRKFNLLGDPTMRLGVPVNRADVATVNGTPVEEQTAPIRALDRVTIAGAVRGPDGALLQDFDGLVDVTVFDAERRVNIPNQRHMATPYYTVREDLIWRGTVRAEGGQYEATFVVPKDISYSNEAGRISVYAHSDARHALGYTENVVVGGTAESPPDDAVGPQIRLFLNDTTFVSGGMTPPEPRLIVKLRDESGINTVGAGVGHEMLLVVDGDEKSAVDISDGFQSDENSYQSGQVVFSLADYPRELEPGAHELVVRAWDVVNNSNEARLAFYVSAAEGLVLRNVFNYPNPTSGETRFLFEHNQAPGTPARVQIRVYTLAGRPVRTFDTDEALPAGVLTSGPVQVFWDGRDDDFDRVATGVYLYKVRVEVETAGGERAVREHIDRIAVIR